MAKIIFDGPRNAEITIALAHGAGGPMDSKFMQFFAVKLGNIGYRVARFEFPYMAERRANGKRRPPDTMAKLLGSWSTVISQLGTENLLIGGKSMGCRVASLIADTSEVKGLICLGYPFHAYRKKSGKNRLDHLITMRTPALICQGTRDPLGSIDEISEYTLSDSIHLHWLDDGDHSFKPRKISGLTEEQNWHSTIDAINKFIDTL